MRHAINGEVGVENFVAAVLRVGLRKHHQLNVAGVAAQSVEGLDEVFNFVFRQCQAPLLVGALQRGCAACQHVHKLHGLGVQRGEQLQRFVAAGHHRFGHAVMQQRCNLADVLRAQLRRATQQARLERHAELGDALHALDRQAAVTSNVSGFGSPRRDRAQTGSNEQRQAVVATFVGVSVCQQGRQTLRLLSSGGSLSGNNMNKAGGNARDLGMDSDQVGQELLGAERAQGVSTLKLSQMQGHVAACLCEGW